MMMTMRFCRGAALTLALGAMTLSGNARAAVIDAVVATVGGEPILQSELMVEIAPFVESLRMANTSDAEMQRQMEDALEQALNTAIEQRLLYRQASLRGLQADDKDVEDRIERIRSQFPSNDAFLKAMQEAGETMSDFRERIRRQMIAVTMGVGQRREFEKEAVITESDIAQYYQDNRNEFSHDERIRLRRIFLDAGSTDEDRAAARARLEMLRSELAQGADFAALAEAHSDGPEADNGGIVGWIERGDLVDALESVVFSLDSGEVSEVIDTEFGLVLMKADQRTGAGTMTLQEARTEIEPILRRRYAAERYDKWMSDLRKRSQVRIFL